MTLTDIWNKWRKFWFEPIKPLSIAIYRVLFGLLILQIALVHIDGNLFDWYGPHAIVTIDTVRSHFWWNEPRFDVLLSFPNTNEAVQLYFYTFVIAAVFVTVGFCTRFSIIFVCLGLISLHHHNPFNNNGGDAFLRICSIYLCFSPAGDRLSLDNIIRRRLGMKPPPITSCPWAQRMVQVQLCMVYAQTFCCKIVGPQWLDGTAVYYATRLDDLIRMSPGPFDQLWFCKFLSWYTLVIEFSMFTLVWFKSLRYPILLGVLILHLGIDLTINLPVFEWAFIITLVTFVEPDDWQKTWLAIQNVRIKNLLVWKKLPTTS